MPRTAPPFRPVSAVDLAAACASLLLPKAWHPRLDQTRLDAHSLLDSIRGRHEVPFRDQHVGPRPPTPLRTIDPVEHLLPRPIAHRYVGIRRDLRFLTLSLRGQHPPPFTRRRAPEPRGIGTVPQPPQISTKTFRVTEVKHPIPDAVTLVLEPTAGAIESFEPGQFLTLILQIEGTRHQRAYSICSPTASLPRVAVTVKRIEGGIVSNYLNEHIRVGDLLHVRGPSGSFTVRPAPETMRHFVLLAAGSGITPLLSIIHALLHDEPNARVVLAYGNRSEQSILFRDELDRYASEFPERFSVHHVLSRPSPAWQGRRGRVDREGASALLDAIAPEPSTEFLICGPSRMMHDVRQLLAARDVPEARIRQERFISPRASATSPRPTSPQVATYHLHGAAHELSIAPDQSLLQAGLDAGLALGYSCAMGGCGACKVKLLRGAVHMAEPNALTSQERDDGYVLACIAHPTEPVEVEST